MKEPGEASREEPTTEYKVEGKISWCQYYERWEQGKERNEGKVHKQGFLFLCIVVGMYVYTKHDTKIDPNLTTAKYYFFAKQSREVQVCFMPLRNNTLAIF